MGWGFNSSLRLKEINNNKIQYYGARKFGENEMRGLQKHKLFHKKEQEKNQGKAGAEKALQEMQKAYGA